MPVADGPAVTAVRETRPDDAVDIARVVVRTWRTTYLGVVPDDYLAAKAQEDIAAFWRELLSGEDGERAARVAVSDDGPVVGIAGAVVPADQPSYASELRLLYVLNDHQGRGAGRQLVRAIAGRLVERGTSPMVLWVFAGNSARRCYEALGGRCGRPSSTGSGGRSTRWSSGGQARQRCAR